MFSFYSLGIGLVLAIANVVRIIMVHNKNNVESSTSNYVAEGNFEVVSKDEKHIRTYETKEKIQTQTTNNK